MNDERAELLAWIRNKRLYFVQREYTAAEVADAAIRDTFDPDLVYRVLSNFRDALEGTSIDHRAEFVVERLEMTLHMLAVPVDLFDSWEALGDYLQDGKEFDDEKAA